MQLWGIYNRFAGSQYFASLIVNEAAAQFEKHFDAIDQKENDHNQQEYCIAAVEDVRIILPIGDNQRREYLNAE